MPNKSYAIYMVKSTELVDDVLKALMLTSQGIGGGRVRLGFCNWDLDPRELYDIPEVQRWCREFVQKGGLSLVDRMEDLRPRERADISNCVPSQMLMVACAGLPGATRMGPKAFNYDLEHIAALERQHRR